MKPSPSNFLKLLYVVFFIVLTQWANAQNMVVIAPNGTYSGTYVYQGTRNSTSICSDIVQTRDYYRLGSTNYYLYADYMNGICSFPTWFCWFICDGLIDSPGSSECIYSGWEATGLGGPETCTDWWTSSFPEEATGMSVTVEVTGTVPVVSSLEASLVTTTAGTIGGNVVADGGATVSGRGLVYSSSDNTPTIGEGTVTQITKGSGLGTFSETLGSLTAGTSYYYQAYGINSVGTSYGGVKSFITPSTSESNRVVSGIISPATANGTYIWIGNYYGKPAWKHETLDYYVYYSRFASSYPDDYYWFIDDELKDNHGLYDFLFWYTIASSTCPSSGWTEDDGTGTVLITSYPQVTFMDGSGFTPGNATGNTTNNLLGQFQLSSDLTGAALTTATISVVGTNTGATNLKLWSSSDATFNSGSDIQLDSQSDGSIASFSGFNSSISTSGTYYFITTDLAVDASGDFTLTIGSQSNLTITGGAIASSFSNAALTSGAVSIIPIREINLTGNSNSIADGDTTPSVTDDTDFGKTDLASGTITKTYTIGNSGAGVLAISSVVLSSTTHFTISSAVPTSVAAGGSENIDVVFNPSTAGVFSATLTINNNDDDEGVYDFSIQGEGIDIEKPSTQAQSILFPEVHAAKLSLSWTRGDGNACAVFVAEGTGGTASPVDDVSYAANSIFGSGVQIGTTGWHCVYNGTGTAVDISNLKPGTSYQVMVCEYNEFSGLIRYSTESALDNPSSQLTRDIFINEIDVDTPGTDSQEFVELYDGGAGNTSLDYLSVVLFNGSLDVSYDTFDLDGYSTDVNGYFLIGGASMVGVDIACSDNTLQNGADAVALFLGDNTDFPSGTAITTTNLIDAIVYDTDDSDDAGLLPLLNAGEPQVNENGRGDSENHSMQRIANGSGGYRNTSTYESEEPTPKAANIPLSVITVEGLSTTIIGDGDSSPDAADNTIFSDAIVNGGTSTQTYTIKNSGLATLEISSMEITGTNASEFSITSSPASTVGAGGSTTFTITFDPVDIGVRAADINISNNDSDRNPYNFSIQGTGINNTPTASSFSTSSGPYQSMVYTFATSDFAYSDIDSDPLNHVRVTAVPASGTLYVDANDSDDYDSGEELSNNDQISKADLDDGNLQYYTTGTTVTSFTFDVNDGIEYSASAYTATLSVVAEPTVILSIDNSSISETGGTTTVIATLSHAFGAMVTVDLSFSGTASLTNDYTRTGTSISILSGDTNGAVTLSAVSDIINESDETVIVDISTVTNGAEDGAQQVTLTISDDDVSELSIAATTQAAEDDADGLFTISTDKQFDAPVTVTFDVDGTATEGTDYGSLGTTIIFPANSSSVTLPVEVLSDDLVESNETVVVSITLTDNVEVTIGTSNEATVTITDDDIAELAITATTQAAEDATDGLFTILTDKQFDAPVTVTFGVDGTATEGTDYNSIGTTIVFPANSSSVTIPVVVIDDNQVESGESVIVTLASSTSNSDVIAGTSNEATVVIANDDILPTVTTLAATDETETSAVLGGNVIDEGSASVTERGIVYSSIDITPEISESGVVKDINGSGAGFFSETRSSLITGTTYYFQAYAITAVGTVYGGIVSFTTYREPLVSTQSVTSIGSSTAIGHGNIIDLGIPNPTQYGLCWNTSGMPTTSDNKTEGGGATATGEFSMTIALLSPATAYYVRAYATNETGTVYGEEVRFTTKKRSQLISFPVISEKTYGDADFSPSAVASSGLSVTYMSSDENVATIINGMIHIENAGTCVIYANQSGNTRYYSASQVSQTLTINKASQYITFNELPEVNKGDDPLVLNATASSGLGVCCECINSELAYIEDGCVVIVDAGAVLITAKQAGNQNYLAAEDVEQMLTINFATGIEELTLSEPLFYPNPVTRMLSLNEACLGATSVKLYNLNGGLVLSEPNPTLQIDCSAINRGVYLIVVDLGEGKRYIEKMIKE